MERQPTPIWRRDQHTKKMRWPPLASVRAVLFAQLGDDPLE